MRTKILLLFALMSTTAIAGYVIRPSSPMPLVAPLSGAMARIPTAIAPYFLPPILTTTAAPSPTMDVLFGSSMDNVGNTLTVNGTSMTLVAEYDARDATTSSWPARTSGATASITGSGTLPSVNQPAPFTDADQQVVLFDNSGAGTGSGQYYATANGALTVGTDDFIVEAVVRSTFTAPASDRAIFGNLSSATGRGWGVFYRSGQSYAFSADDDGVGACYPVGSVTSVGNAAFDILHFTFDRSVGIRAYRNGVLAQASACTTAASSIDQTGVPFALGAYGTLPLGGGSGIAKLRIWRCAGCINTTSELDSLMKDRATAIEGLTSDVVASGATTPSTTDRVGYTSMPVFNNSVLSEFTVGNHWGRVASTSSSIKGFYASPQSTNLLLRSDDLSNATWTSPTAGDTATANALLSPFNDFSADSFDAALDAVGVEHCKRQPVTLTATSHTFSAWVKGGTNTWMFLRNSTIANGAAWINTSTCAIGTTQAGVTASSVAYGNSWCRFAITFTGTAASHNLDVCGASGDGLITYTESANSTADWNAVGFQVEALPFPTGSIKTVASQITMVGDDFRWPGASLAANASGTHAVDVVFPFAVGATTRIPWVANAGGAGVNFVEHLHSSSLLGASGSGGLSIVGTGAIDNGASRAIRLIVASNNTRNYVDGTLTGTDTTHTLPAGIDTVEIGNDVGATTTANSNAYVSRYRYWTTEVLP